MKKYGGCIVCLLGCAIGMAAVHVTAYNMAMNVKSTHLSRSEANWFAFLHDCTVGIPISGLCGWAAAFLLKKSQSAEPESGE